MADLKISQLTALGASPADGDLIPIVDVSDTTMAASGTTKKLSAIYVARSDGANKLITGSARELTVPATGTAALIDYGIWTPVLVSTGATFSWSVATGKYWNIGQITYFNGVLLANGAASGTLTNPVTMTGLPFPAAATYPGVVSVTRISNHVYPTAAKRLMLYLAASSQTISLLWERDDDSNLDAVANDVRSASFRLYFGGFYAT